MVDLKDIYSSSFDLQKKVVSCHGGDKDYRDSLIIRIDKIESYKVFSWYDKHATLVGRNGKNTKGSEMGSVEIHMISGNYHHLTFDNIDEFLAFEERLEEII